MSPWNYPLFLTVSPLTSVLAAGNRAMIKMATQLADTSAACSPRSSRAQFSGGHRSRSCPACRAQDFSTLPFDHIIFTGSADAGRTVMRVGGREPDAGHARAGRQVADDHLRRLRRRRRPPSQHPLRQVHQRRPDLPGARLPLRPRGQARAVRRRRQAHRGAALSRHQRPQLHLDHRREVLPPPARHARRRRSARARSVVPLVPGATFNDLLRKIPPHLVLDPTDDMTIMQEEIFGPLFPVKTYRDLDEVIAYVNANGPPARLLLLHQRQGDASRSCCTARSPAASPSTTACCTSPSTTCRSAASAPAAWASTTATRASSSSASCGRCSPTRASRCCTGSIRRTPARHARLFDLLLKFKR